MNGIQETIRQPDFAQIDPFLTAIHGSVNGNTEIRILPEGKQLFSRNRDKLNEFVQSNINTNVHFGVASRKGQNGSKAGCDHLTALWSDMDFKDFGAGYTDAVKQLQAFRLEPSIIIMTGNGLHVYWLLEQPVAASLEVESYLKGIAKELNADLAAAEIAHLMRLPGTFNCKDPNNIIPVELYSINKNRYALCDFASWKVNLRPQRPKRSVNFSDLTTPIDLTKFDLSPKMIQLIDGKWRDGGYASRSEADQAVITALLAKGAKDGEIEAVFKHYPVGEKYREKGNYGRSYLEQCIRAADSHLESQERNPSSVSFNSYHHILDKPTLHPDALYGFAGECVSSIDPYTEAAQVAVLANLLVAFGNIIGRRAYYKVEFTRHYLNLFVGQVGETSKGRKGTAWSAPKWVMTSLDSRWVSDRITSGLSSGEGLINAVRDTRFEKQPIKEKGRVIDYQQVIVDEGITDKRLLLIEEELASALKVMSREGNILSAVIRQAWDNGNLNPLVKNNPIKATDAHISIIGHITKNELLRYLNETEQANGFANRFLWLSVERSKIIANPTGTPTDVLEYLTNGMEKCLRFSQEVDEIKRDQDAELFWSQIYPGLSEGKMGMLGAVTSRAEAQTMRLACLYALLDMSATIKLPHLKAALAFWNYAFDSAQFIFGNSSGDNNFDKAKTALADRKTLTLTELSGLFSRNLSQKELDRIVTSLVNQGLATVETSQVVNGRTSRIIRATK